MPNEEEKPWKVIDYIDRFQVLEILNKQISFYAEPPVDKRELELLYELRVRIKDISSIDAVEVVRCRKCKHGDVSTISMSKDGAEDIACYCKLKGGVTDVDSYCPSGERRDT